MFTVRTRAAESLARTGTLQLAHGEVQTPAFVPLATRGAVKTLEAHEVAALGYELILGNTFHLFLAPGPELVARLGGLHEFMRWEQPIITDSGGFQVFSMGHGGVADEIKGRGPAAATARDGAILSIDEEGVRFRSYLDGSEQFLGPETSMEVQAALGSDIALVFDECTPFHVSREYTARSTERTHRWLERCLRWHGEHGPAGQVVYGIVQGGVEQDLRRESTAAVAASGCDGIAIGGSLGHDKAQMHEVVSWTTAELERLAPDRPTSPARDRRHRRPDRRRGAGDRHVRLRAADAARAPRGGARPRPRDPLAARSGQGPVARVGRADPRGLPVSGLPRGYTRAYLHYLLRAREVTALRLVTLHNLSFIARLMSDLRAAIDAGRLGEVAAALRGGARPGRSGRRRATSCAG